MGAVRVNAGNQAVAGGGNDARILPGQKLLKQLLIFPMSFGQQLPLGGVVRVLQGEKASSGGHRLFQADIHLGNGAVEGGGQPGIVDFQGTGAKTFQRHGVAYGVAVVGDGHGQLPVQIGFHPAGDGFPGIQGHVNGVAGNQLGGNGQGDAHPAVQAQQRQSPVLHQHLGHGIAGARVNGLHPASGRGGDGGGGFFIGIDFHLLFHGSHGSPYFGDGGEGGNLVDFRHRVAFFDLLAVFHQEFGDFHLRGQLNVLAVPGFQGAAAPDDGLDGAFLDLRFQHARHRAVLGILLPGQGGQHCQTCHHHRQHSPQDVPADIFLLRLVHSYPP